MSFVGQLLGGGIGFALGGPIGAILGAVIGGSMGSSNVRASRLQQSQMIYFVTTFSMLGKMAAADGVVSSEEVQMFRKLIQGKLNLNPQSQEFASKVFAAASKSRESFQQFATQFATHFRAEPALIHSMMDLLIQMSMADGVLSSEEELLLEEAAKIFGVSNHDFGQLRSKNNVGSNKDYEILGCTRQSSWEEIRSSYRKLVSEYHPDKIVAKGLPEDFMEYARSRFQEIQAAYDRIKNERTKSGASSS